MEARLTVTELVRVRIPFYYPVANATTEDYAAVSQRSVNEIVDFGYEGSIPFYRALIDKTPKVTHYMQ